MTEGKKQDCPRDEAGFCVGGLWGICPEAKKPSGEACGRKRFNAAWDRRYVELKNQMHDQQRREAKVMGHHIDKQGRFQSDKYPQLPPDKIALSFHDPLVRDALLLVAEAYAEKDAELSEDILKRLRTIGNIFDQRRR